MLALADGRPGRRGALVLAFLLAVASAATARADDPRSGYLIKLLSGSSQFRVRAQAAISLGAVESSPAVASALGEALNDVHPAVRAAAATSLGRVGDKSSLARLRALDRDPEEPVRAAARVALAKLETSAASAATTQAQAPAPSGPPQYYVAIAEPATRVASVDRKALAQARDYIKQRVSEMQGVVLAPDTEGSNDAERVLKRKGLKGYYLDSSITSVEKKPDGATRVAVSVIVATYPGRDMRAIMQGAATVSGGGSQDYGQALQGALSGALRQLPQAMNH
ncbi:MAG TPA: HEAT repeat domain-containing protein [Polyangiales bacterium]